MKRTLTSSLIALAASVALVGTPAAAAPAPSVSGPASAAVIATEGAAAPTGVTSGGAKWLCKTFGIFC